MLEIDDVASKPQKPSAYQGSPSNRGGFTVGFSPGSRINKMSKAQSCITSKLKSPANMMKNYQRDKNKNFLLKNPVPDDGSF